MSIDVSYPDDDGVHWWNYFYSADDPALSTFMKAVSKIECIVRDSLNGDSTKFFLHEGDIITIKDNRSYKAVIINIMRDQYQPFVHVAWNGLQYHPSKSVYSVSNIVAKWEDGRRIPK